MSKKHIQKEKLYADIGTFFIFLRRPIQRFILFSCIHYQPVLRQKPTTFENKVSLTLREYRDDC